MQYSNTTDIPDKLIAIAVAFSIAEGVEIEKVTVKNKKAGIIGGQWGWYFPRTKEIVVIVPRVLSGFVKVHPTSRAQHTLNSRVEFLVSVIAHELRHAWQYQVGDLPVTFFRNNYLCECDAEAYETRQLNAWRKAYGECEHERVLKVACHS